VEGDYERVNVATSFQRHQRQYPGTYSPSSIEEQHSNHSNTPQSGPKDMDFPTYDPLYPNEDIDVFKQLSIRGTGSYTCEHEYACQKGGVNPDGSLKVFIRNSEFKTHMMKHRKDYKCDLPNCPNKGKGFARPDQLARHKQNVKHEPARFLPPSPGS
jgi:hypothetical protein